MEYHVKGVSPYDLCANFWIKGILERSGRKRFYSSAEYAAETLERLRTGSGDDVGFPMDPGWKTFAGRSTFGGYPLYRFSSGNESGRIILYLHGGGFVNQPEARHFKMVDKLCARSGAEIYFPLYPKAPLHDFRETYDLTEAIYLRLLRAAKGREIVFMGDSAGAMLCVTLCAEFKRKGLALPAKLILYSLVAETALDNPEIAMVDPKDPMQGADGLREYIRSWAGDEPINSPLIDPMSADLSVLPETLIVGGMNEIFRPDLRLFAQKADEAGADVTLYLFRHMYHCFPLFDLQAARTVRRLTCEWMDHGDKPRR